MSSDWIDISAPLSAGMAVYPGDPEVVIDTHYDMKRGDPCTVSKLNMGAHTGTHMDSPCHYLAEGRSIDEMPLTATIGPARVVDAQGEGLIQAVELDRHSIERGERLLVKAGGRALSCGAAQLLASRAVCCIGLDGMSAGDADVHKALLEANVWIIEGLELSRVDPGAYEMVCLPLKIAGGDGAPARAVLRRPG